MGGVLNINLLLIMTSSSKFLWRIINEDSSFRIVSLMPLDSTHSLSDVTDDRSDFSVSLGVGMRFIRTKNGDPRIGP